MPAERIVFQSPRVGARGRFGKAPEHRNNPVPRQGCVDRRERRLSEEQSKLQMLVSSCSSKVQRDQSSGPDTCDSVGIQLIVAKILRDELALRGIRSLTAEESEAIAARMFERITELELELAARDFNIRASADVGTT